MLKLESIVRNFNFKKYLIYPLFFLSLNCGGDDSTNNPVQPTPTPNKLPETTIIKPSNNQSFNTNSVTVEWSGSDSDGRIIGYGIVLDGSVGYVTSTSKTYTNLINGSHVFRVTSQDDKEAYDPTPAEVNFNVQAEIIGPVDNTDPNGYAKLEIGSAIFDVYVKNQSNQVLNNIMVSGFNYQPNIYGFLSEDFSGRYMSELVNYAPGLLKADLKNSNPTISIFQRAKENNRIRIQKLFNYRLNKGVLVFKDKVALSDLSEIYKKYDALFQSVSLLEFLVSNTEAGTLASSAFTFALQAAKFREEIINNANNVSTIINTVASYFGQGYDADAYYFDIYQHKDLKILTHVPNEENLCTLKGSITNVSNQLVTNALITLGSGILSDSTDLNGKYILKKVLASGYTATVTATGYQSQTKFINIVAPNLPFYTSTKLDFQLTPKATQQTITIQPNSSEGKDAYVEIIKHPQNPCMFYCNDNFGNDTTLIVEDRVQSNQVEDNRRSFLQFNLSTVPSGATINSAKLYLYGNPSSNNFSSSSVVISCSEVLNDWLEGTITWNNQPNLGNSLDSKTINYDGDPTNQNDSYFESWDITSLAKQWYTNQKPNYGVSLTTNLSGEIFSGFFMKSSDSKDSSKRPKLIITYTK